MCEDDGFASVEPFHHRNEHRIALVFALITGHQADSVGLERIQAVFDLAKAALDIR
jgi:hypothetical protein